MQALLPVLHVRLTEKSKGKNVYVKKEEGDREITKNNERDKENQLTVIPSTWYTVLQC